MRVGIDFDGTIADTNRAKSDWIRRELDMIVPPYLCDRTSAVPIIGETQYALMSRLMYSEEGTLALEPVAGFCEAFTRIVAKHRVFVITARHGDRLGYAERWLALHHLNYRIQLRGVSARQTTKINVCKSAGIQILIDDDSRHLPDGSERGIDGILFKPGAPTSYKCDGATVCRSWSEIARLLLRWE